MNKSVAPEDGHKTKAQLLELVQVLRKEVATLESSALNRERVDKDYRFLQKKLQVLNMQLEILF